MSDWFSLAQELVSRFEGCKLEAYQDAVGVCTIGWGTTGTNVVPGITWTQEQADNARDAKLNEIGARIDQLVTVPVTDGQKGALCSFSYNLGTGALAESTLLKLLNEGNAAGAAAEFPKWRFAGKVELPGLLARRLAEQKVFLS